MTIVGKCPNQITSPYFDYLSEGSRILWRFVKNYPTQIEEIAFCPSFECFGNKNRTLCSDCGILLYVNIVRYWSTHASNWTKITESMNSSRFDLLAVIFFSKLLNFCSLAVRFSCLWFLATNDDKNAPFLYMHYFLDLIRVGLNIVLWSTNFVL